MDRMMEECIKNGVDEFVEIGPTQVLTKFIKQINKNVKLVNFKTNNGGVPFEIGRKSSNCNWWFSRHR